MKQRLLSILLICIMVFGCMTEGFAAERSSDGLDYFKAVQDYTEGQFTDVKSSDWFSDFVASAYRLNLMNGNSATTFNPNGNVTIAETITVAARLHSIYNTGSADNFSAASPWYMSFVNYALENGIISSGFADYSRPATRAEYVTILSKAFPESAFPAISDIDDNAIPDVPTTRSYASAVYMLYRAGIISGSDSQGNFNPDSNIKRSEVATILIKMADKSQRKETTLKLATALDAVAISEKCSSAVFYIEIYNASGVATSSGSGFFIDSSGLAVTNYHVIEGAASASVKLNDGTVKKVLGVYDYSEDNDLALLKIDGSDFNYLEADTGTVVAGQTVFAIGSPLGLDNTISQGIVSNPKRTVDGLDYIQFTAPISHGNSGGAVLNDSGKVIGVSSAFFDSDGTAQNLNLAIPMSYVSSLTHDAYTPLGSAASSSAAAETTDDSSAVTDQLEYLKDQMMKKGNYDDGNYSLGKELADGVVSVYYDVEEDEINIIYGSETYDGRDKIYVLCGITFSEISDSYSYLFHCELTPYRSATTKLTGTGKLNPATFSENSTLSFAKYDGLSGLKASAQKLAVSSLNIAIYGGGIVLQDNGIDCSLADLNFKNF